MITPPSWLAKRVQYWADLLLLGEWDIRISVARVVDGDEDARGIASAYPDINRGLITFRSDIDRSEEWEITIVHELLHIAHGRIDDLVERVFLSQLDEGQRMGVSVYRSVMESYTDRMAKALVRAQQNERKGLAMASVAAAAQAGVLGSDPVDGSGDNGSVQQTGSAGADLHTGA